MGQKVNAIIKQMQENGYRITEQRKNLISVILENECSTCKEIYYKAIENDPTVGIATVYRTVSILENLGVLNRNNIFDVAYDKIMDEGANRKNATFVCTKCGAVRDIEIHNIMMSTKDGSGKKQQRVITATIKGICSECEECEENDQLSNSGGSHIDCSRCNNIPCKIS